MREAWWRLGSALAIACLLTVVLHGCGGGGGSGGETSPPGAGGGAGGSNPPAATPSGRLWHNNFALDGRSGTQTASLNNGAPAYVDPDTNAAPWRDGTQYVVTDYRPAQRETTITFKEFGTGRVLVDAVYTGYARSARPSPISKDVVLLTVSDSITEPAEYAFINLRTRTILDSFDESTVSVDWLPDGRYLQVATNGQISIGTVGGARTAAGNFNLQGRRLGTVSVSPQGTRFAVTLAISNGPVVERDLWVADLDGSNAGRMTTTRITTYGQWSPDSRFIAFNTDTGFVCAGSGCIGSCELWVAQSDARGLNPLPSAPGQASSLRVRDATGSERSLGCNLVDWTN